MAQKISWQDPQETSVTNIEISTSGSIFGSYVVATTIDATSDGGAKSTSNTWVTNYTDSSGTKDTWYKIRFYDGTNYSDYSESITANEIVKLCNVDEVRNIINTVGIWTDDQIFDMINQTDKLIYVEMGTPVHSTWSPVSKLNNVVQYRYYTGEENIYRVDRVFYGTTTMTEAYLDDQYKTNLQYGMIEILPVASSSITLDVTQTIEIHYVPSIFNQLCLYRTCQGLLEQLDTTSGGETSKELTVINEKVKMVETILAHRVGVRISSQSEGYNGVYGVNRKMVVQNFDRNRFLASTGW